MVALAMLMLLGAMVSCSEEGDYKQLAADRKTVATCNGFEIPYEELRFVTVLYKKSLAHAYGEDIWDAPETAEKYRAELEELVAENLNQSYLILSACKDMGIDIDSKAQEEYVDEQMEKMLEEEYGNDKKAMLEEFDKEGMTQHYMRFSIGVEYLHSALFYAYQDANLFNFSTKNIGDFIDFVMENEHYARTIHIYIRNDKGDDIEANRAKAQNVVDQIRNIPVYSDRIETMYTFIGSSVNEDTYQTSRNGYYFTYGEMEQAYEDTAFALNDTEVSDVVEITDGFYVIMRLAPDEDYVTQNAATLLTYYQSAALGRRIDEYKEKCPVVFNDYGKSIDLTQVK